LPIRTITAVKLLEFGPVDYPAYEAASAGVRHRSDYEIWKALDTEGRAEFVTLIRSARESLGNGDSKVAPIDNGDSQRSPLTQPQRTQVVRRLRHSLQGAT